MADTITAIEITDYPVKIYFTGNGSLALVLVFLQEVAPDTSVMTTQANEDGYYAVYLESSRYRPEVENIITSVGFKLVEFADSEVTAIFI
jgi:hypothetical protein